MCTKVYALMLMLFAVVSVYGQDNVIDEVVWVVGDEAILKSDVENERLNAQYEGRKFDGDPYCIIPEQLAIQKLFLHQAAIDSIEVSEQEIISDVERRTNWLIDQIGSKEKVEEYYNKTSTQIREMLRENIRDGHLFLKVVNPLRYPKEGEECELFRSTDKVRMAWGVTHLLDNVPYKEGSLLRNMIINHLGRSQYYRCFRKERPFAPQDQQTIRMLFRQRGISEEPSFDYYTNEFNW